MQRIISVLEYSLFFIYDIFPTINHICFVVGGYVKGQPGHNQAMDKSTRYWVTRLRGRCHHRVYLQPAWRKGNAYFYKAALSFLFRVSMSRFNKLLDYNPTAVNYLSAFLRSLIMSQVSLKWYELKHLILGWHVFTLAGILTLYTQGQFLAWKSCRSFSLSISPSP